MEQRELETFRATLQAMLRDVTRQPVRREEIAVESAADAIDHSQQLAERDLAIQQIESNFDRAQSIKVALDRIADGSYGTCLMCDGEISWKRLNAVPWTALCVRCQDIKDRGRTQPENERIQALWRLRDVA
jgi:DnaK suppressor protein